ncbi:hypothetical protein AFLA_001633 [Aspergillus flavus NRRL3357]|uniref:Uncharacterized protein n=1 Tax=Aspergillus flavus TaxID=5059 RepID=A0AB74C699_ASPFL|nr:hypothetical protein AFLA_001633 [Aspergillus flavus NRRL3357]RAQ48306.1 hypothetical protein AFGD_004209 [Aspergillus flavus]RAQ77719.1 hypothetical protein COH21_005801 [Aspergillus flavus]RMZ41659.1 hypothetical protein CA14_011365 [Aspergillus flavus]
MEVTVHYGHKEYNVGRFLETQKVSDVIGAAKSLLKLPDHPAPYLTSKGCLLAPRYLYLIDGASRYLEYLTQAKILESPVKY